MHVSCTAGLLLHCADAEHRQLLRNTVTCDLCCETCTGDSPLRSAVQAMKWTSEWLMFSGPWLGRGRGLVGGAHVWRSEGVKGLRGVVRICVVCSGTGSMPHSRSWCNRVSCTGRHQKWGDVAGSWRSGHGWGNLEDRCMCIGAQLITAPHMHIISTPTSVGGWTNNVHMDSDVWQTAAGGQLFQVGLCQKVEENMSC